MSKASAEISHFNTPGSAGKTSRLLLASVLHFLRATIARHRTRIAFGDLDDHILRDIGIQSTPDLFSMAIDRTNWRSARGRRSA